jgi:hypothetical protein
MGGRGKRVAFYVCCASPGYPSLLCQGGCGEESGVVRRRGTRRRLRGPTGPRSVQACLGRSNAFCSAALRLSLLSPQCFASPLHCGDRAKSVPGQSECQAHAGACRRRCTGLKVRPRAGATATSRAASQAFHFALGRRVAAGGAPRRRRRHMGPCRPPAGPPVRLAAAPPLRSSHAQGANAWPGASTQQQESMQQRGAACWCSAAARALRPASHETRTARARTSKNGAPLRPSPPNGLTLCISSALMTLQVCLCILRIAVLD